MGHCLCLCCIRIDNKQLVLMLLTSNNVSLHHCLATIPLFNRRCWTLPLWMQSLAATIYRCNGLPICSVICWTTKIALSLVMEKKIRESTNSSLGPFLILLLFRCFPTNTHCFSWSCNIFAHIQLFPWQINVILFDF